MFWWRNKGRSRQGFASFFMPKKGPKKLPVGEHFPPHLFYHRNTTVPQVEPDSSYPEQGIVFHAKKASRRRTFSSCCPTIHSVVLCCWWSVASTSLFLYWNITGTYSLLRSCTGTLQEHTPRITTHYYTVTCSTTDAATQKQIIFKHLQYEPCVLIGCSCTGTFRSWGRTAKYIIADGSHAGTIFE